MDAVAFSAPPGASTLCFAILAVAAQAGGQICFLHPYRLDVLYLSFTMVVGERLMSAIPDLR